MRPSEVIKLCVGVHPYVEQTGGGCEALVAPLEGGAHLVVTSDLALPWWGSSTTTVCLYLPGQWDDSGQDPAGAAWSGEPLTRELLGWLIAEAMEDAFPQT